MITGGLLFWIAQQSAVIIVAQNFFLNSKCLLTAWNVFDSELLIGKLLKITDAGHYLLAFKRTHSAC